MPRLRTTEANNASEKLSLSTTAATPKALTSREKKRLRDRRAQNALRARRDAYVHQLEERVAICERDHANLGHNQCRAEDIVPKETVTAELTSPLGPSVVTPPGGDTVVGLRAMIEALRRENAELRRRQAMAAELLHLSSAEDLLVKLPMSASSSYTPDSNLAQCASASHYLQAQYDENLHDDDGEMLWPQLPQHHPYDSYIQTFVPWFLCPAVVDPTPEVPLGPDLLYGTPENPLANAIFITLSCAHNGEIPDIERVALGWLFYTFTKWVLRPTRARFARVPAFLRPTALQRQRLHTCLLDFCLWPGLRDRLIASDSTLSQEDILLVGRLMMKHYRLRWPRDAPIFEPSAADVTQLVVRSEFLDVITKIENWTLPESMLTDDNLAASFLGTMRWVPVPDMDSLSPGSPGETPVTVRRVRYAGDI